MFHTLMYIVGGLWFTFVFVYSLFVHPVKGTFDKVSKIVWGTLSALFLLLILWIASLN